MFIAEYLTSVHGSRGEECAAIDAGNLQASPSGMPEKFERRGSRLLRCGNSPAADATNCCQAKAPWSAQFETSAHPGR